MSEDNEIKGPERVWVRVRVRASSGEQTIDADDQGGRYRRHATVCDPIVEREMANVIQEDQP